MDTGYTFYVCYDPADDYYTWLPQLAELLGGEAVPFLTKHGGCFNIVGGGEKPLAHIVTPWRGTLEEFFRESLHFAESLEGGKLEYR